jgi:hypothetical protein
MGIEPTMTSDGRLFLLMYSYNLIPCAATGFKPAVTQTWKFVP